MGIRVILQTRDDRGMVFDASGVREVSVQDAWTYMDGKPCYLLVSADGRMTFPSPDFAFCTVTIVVTSPNLKSKPILNAWRKQSQADQFVAPPPSCAEVVYLLYVEFFKCLSLVCLLRKSIQSRSEVWNHESSFVYWMYREWARDFRCCHRDCKTATHHIERGTLFKWYEEKIQDIKSHARGMLSGSFNYTEVHQLPDDDTRLLISSDLVTMERRNGSTSRADVVFVTPRIANIVAEVQQEQDWLYNWRALNIFFRNPDTRGAAGKLFQKMFIENFRTDPSKMPPCFEMDEVSGIHRQSPLGEKAKAVMPWEGLDCQPTLEYLSIGSDADGSYSSKELRTAIKAAMDRNSPPIRLLIPSAQNWVWDAAIIMFTEENGERTIHIIFLQTTLKSEHEIYAKGLNHARDAIPAEWKCGKGPHIYYHYILVLLVEDGAKAHVPKWRHVLKGSKQREKDPSWHRENLKQYIMFVHKEDCRHVDN